MQQMIEQCSQMMNGMMGNGMMMSMLLSTLLIIALVVAGVVLLVRFLQNRTTGNDQTPEAILAERFARGEIGFEEYQERRGVLQSY